MPAQYNRDDVGIGGSMQKITGFESASGRVFKEEREALVDENAYLLRKKVHEFFELHGWSNMTITDATSMVVENAQALLEILTLGRLA